MSKLTDIAEQNNPETGDLWERAKQRAATVGIAKSALFPTVAALASASVNQYSLFLGKVYDENTTTHPSILSLSYYPVVSFTGSWGYRNGFREPKNFGSTARSAIFPYQAQIQVNRSILDGGARKNEVATRSRSGTNRRHRSVFSAMESKTKSGPLIRI